MGQKQKIEKDWTDAIREKYLSEDEAFSPGGWETVRRRVRRGEILRRSAVAAAAVLLPFAALLLWSPRHSTVPVSEPIIAVTDDIPTVPDAIEELIVAVEESVNILPTKPDNLPVAADLSLEQQSLSPSADTENTTDTTSHIAPPPSEQHTTRRVQELVPDDLVSFAEPGPRQKRKVSLGISVGSAAIHRDNWFNTMSALYFTQLAYLNTGDAIDIGSTKINAANISTHFQFLLTKASNFAAYMPNPITPSNVHYVHDLPLTFGLQARLSLLPWLGVESGVEYTYLHSVADSYLGTLDQRLHFIGVPIRMNARIWSNNQFEVYLGLGGKMDKCVSASLGKIRCEEPCLQWSVEATGGIQYRLWEHMSLYFQPELSFYLTHTSLVTYRTEHPLGVALQAGLRFDMQ